MRTFRSRLCDCPAGAVDCIEDAETLTQFALRAGDFRTAPRDDREVDLSLLRGKQSTLEAARYVLRDDDPDPKRVARAGVRYSTAGALRKAGFAVVHTPGRIVEGTHVSVIWPAEDPLEVQTVPWPPDMGRLLDACFNE